MKMALPCIACGRELKNVDEYASENQPYAGTSFSTHGHYGSTAFDPFDGQLLEINICDLCLVLHRDRVLAGRDRRPVLEDGIVIGWEDTKWLKLPWIPNKVTIDNVLAVARKEFEIDDLKPEELEKEETNS